MLPGLNLQAKRMTVIVIGDADDHSSNTLGCSLTEVASRLIGHCTPNCCTRTLPLESQVVSLSVSSGL